MKKFITSISIFVIWISIFTSSCSTGKLSNPPTTISSPISSPLSSSSLQVPVSPDLNSASSLTTPLESPNNNEQGTTWNAPITINQSSEGQILRVNLVKFVVTASPSANVTINDIPAVKDVDGSYYSFLDLTPGKNIINIKTAVGDIVDLHETMVTFSPPLFVYLNHPNFGTNSNDTDYSKTPVNITGYVSNPQAEVKINDIPVSVNEDGTFSVDIPGKNTFGSNGGTSLASVTATLGNESDSYELNLFVENGKIGVIPGLSLLQSTDYSPGDLSGHPGQSTFTTGTLIVRKDVEPSTIARFDIGEEPSGIEVIVNPATFRIYPNVIYTIPITIKTDKNVTPGNYQSFSLYIGSYIIVGPMNIAVDGSNGR